MLSNMKSWMAILGLGGALILSGCASSSTEHLSTGDSVFINIGGLPDMSGTYRVDDLGRIEIPRIGFVAVRNSDATQTSRRVQTLLQSQGFGRPQVYTVVGKRASDAAIDPALYKGLPPPFISEDGEPTLPPNAQFLPGGAPTEPTAGGGAAGAGAANPAAAGTGRDGDAGANYESPWGSTPAGTADWAPNEPVGNP